MLDESVCLLGGATVNKNGTPFFYNEGVGYS